MIETITFEDVTLALIVRKSFHKEGINFITDGNGLLEMGYFSHPSGHLIIPHYHPPTLRKTYGTQEVILIKKGKVRVDFYTNEQVYLESRELSHGDWIVLLAGGHGIKTLEPTVMIEVKNGPYAYDHDKIQFKTTQTMDKG